METPNWPCIIKEINADGGMSYREIARALDCSVGAIWSLSSGDAKDPAYTRGVQLLALHKKTMRKAARRKA